MAADPAAVAVAEESHPRQDKRGLLDAAQTLRKLPLHFGLLASSQADSVDAQHPHPGAAQAVEAAQQSLWPVTLLEAAHSASVQFHGQPSSLRDSAVMSAATASEAGRARRLGKSLNPERRRAAVVPLLSNGRPATQLLLPAPSASGSVPVLVATQNALLDTHAADSHDGGQTGLFHLRLPTNTPSATAADDTQPPHRMDATVMTPGAGALHCAAFRAAVATCLAWDAKLPCDPFGDAFCSEEHAAVSGGTPEPRLDLPPPPADADNAALEVCSRVARWRGYHSRTTFQELLRRSHAAWHGPPDGNVADVHAPAAERGLGPVPPASQMHAAPGGVARGLPAAAQGRPPAAKPTKKRARRDGF